MNEHTDAPEELIPTRCPHGFREADCGHCEEDAFLAYERDKAKTQLADLARLAKALDDALPRCGSDLYETNGCTKVATLCEEGDCGEGYQCDDHGSEDFELDYAAPLRALQAKLATLDGAAEKVGSDG